MLNNNIDNNRRLTANVARAGVWSRLPVAFGGALLLAGSLFFVGMPRTFADSDSDTPASVATQKVDLDIVNANLLSVVQVLKLQSHAQIVVVGGPKNYGPVSATISGSLDTILPYVASSAGATVTRDDNGIYTFRPLTGPLAAPAGASLVNNGQLASYTPNSNNPSQPQPPAQDSGSETRHWEKIVLQNVDPNFILNELNDTYGLRDSDPFDNPIVKIKPVPTGLPGPDITTTPTSYNPASTEQPSVPVASQNYGANQGANQANRSNSAADQANQFPGAGGFNGGFGGQFGNPGAGGFNGNGGAGGGFNGTTAAGNNGQNNSLRPQGIDSIISNEEDNALIVKGTAQGIAELKQLINYLDRAPRQVQIKLEYITATVNDIDNFHLTWDLIPYPSLEAGFPGGSGTGTSFISYSHGNLVTQLQLDLEHSLGKVVQSSIITTTNNVPGSISSTQQIPYTSSTTQGAATQNTNTTSTVSFLTVPNSFSVVPRINGDDSISLLLSPSLSSVGAPSAAGGAPPVTTQTVRSYRTVANGETMVIGGVINKSDTNATTKVPYLSTLPIIGSLFRTRNHSISDSETLLFITPTILPPIGANLANSPSAVPTAAAQAGADATSVGVSP